MRKILCGVLAWAVLAALLASCGSAADTGQTSEGMYLITNNTNYTIEQLYMSPGALNEWGDNLLAGQTLAPGEGREVALVFQGDYTYWDFKAGLLGGDEMWFEQMELRRYSAIELTMEGDTPVAGLS